MQKLWEAFRPYQWIKSVFVFLPLVFGGKLFIRESLSATAAMAFFFALASSAVYLVNDIFDREEDCRHPQKSKRPIASGELSVCQGWAWAGGLGTIALAGSFLISRQTGWLIAFYFLLNFLYCVSLKKIIILDVFCVGAFYYLRIVAGGLTTGVMLSNWIIMCTVLLALFLGFNKRKADLEYNHQSCAGQRYDAAFLDRMISITAVSLIMSYALYVMDKETIHKFATTALVYSVPFVYYGIFRYIYLADSHLGGGDPVRVLFKDRQLLLTVVLWLVICAVIIY